MPAEHNLTQILDRDASELDQIQNEIRVFKHAAWGIYNHLQGESAKLKRRINARVPIHKLPPEILTNILLLDLRAFYARDLDVDHGPLPHSRRRNLAGVCHSWLNLVIDTPALWTDIQREDKDRVVALTRSRNAPLRIHYRYPKKASLHSASSDFLQFLQEVAPSLHRWQSVRLAVPLMSRNIAGEMQKCIQGETASLLDFAAHRINALLSEADQSLYYFDLKGNKGLRHVSLSGFSLAWHSARLSNLRSLELGRLQTQTPTLEELDRIFTSSPQLERLALVNLGLAPGGHEEPQPGRRPTEMRSLISIHLEGLPQLLLSYVLSSIHPEALETLYIDVRKDPVKLEKCHAQLAQLATSILCAVPTITLTQERDGSSVVIESEGRQSIPNWTKGFHDRPEALPPLWICFPIGNPMAAWRTVAGVVAASGTQAAIDLQVEWECEGGTERCCPLEILDMLPNIMRMTLRCKHHALPLVHHLGEVRYDDNGSAYNPCPRLKVLNLKTVQVDAGVMEAVQSQRVHRIEKISQSVIGMRY